MNVTSNAYREGGMIPSKYTCDGQNVNPPLMINNIPPGAKSLALVMEDPDAFSGSFIHWVMYDIPVAPEIKENSAPGAQGKTSFGKLAYGGPCPPSGTHRYIFRVFALDTELKAGEGLSKSELQKAMENHVIDRAELMGRYSRS
ncbi:MAG TPA: YbhB/YbcL family Raf kinase inhibitor-like protein [Spirochaetia bacterium]|nr:YbhB/YbcL family Raf kinase inhibitor-like protein [Spirochaetia bacterium]